jgi:hypothetical protein
VTHNLLIYTKIVTYLLSPQGSTILKCINWMNFDLNSPVLHLLKYIVSFIVPMGKEIVEFSAKKNAI